MQHRQHYPMVLIAAMTICVLLYASFGTLNYAVLGDDVNDVIFFNLPQNRIIASVECFYATAIFFTVPLNFFPLAHIFETSIFRVAVDRGARQPSSTLSKYFQPF